MRQLLLRAALICAAACGVLSAETYIANAEIPFPFQANGRMLDAGRYVIVQAVGPQGSSLRNIATGEKTFLNTSGQTETGKRSAQLIFDRVGSRYVLTQMWTREGHGAEVEMTKSSRERVSALETSTVVIKLNDDRARAREANPERFRSAFVSSH